MILETRDEQDERLRGAVSWQHKRKPTVGKLGTDLREYLGRHESRFNKNAAVVDLWRELLPEQFYDHCELVGLLSGVLYIKADPGPYMHELRLLSNELLGLLRQKCPRAGIKKIVIRTS